MTNIINNIPAGIVTRFLTETESADLPAIWREGTTLFIPTLVRQTENGYRCFIVPVPYTGQDYTDYDKCVMQSYAPIRKFFYGDAAAQSEMRDDHLWEGHRQAVRTAFPKYEGEPNLAAARFQAVYDAFWDEVDAALREINKTRADLPAYFTAETMLEFATENGMSDESLAHYVQVFSTISLDLLHNDRNWSELFA